MNGDQTISLPRSVVVELINMAAGTGHASGYIDDCDTQEAMADEDIRAAAHAAHHHFGEVERMTDRSVRELIRSRGGNFTGSRNSGYIPKCICGWIGEPEIDEVDAGRFEVVHADRFTAHRRAREELSAHASAGGAWKTPAPVT